MTDKKILNEELDKIIEFYKTELASIRTGRATPSLVENIQVDYYGNKTPLIQIATINAPEPKMLVIQPWDKNVIKEIEKAIASSDLGISPVNEGDIIRLVIPPMTEERRDSLAKVVHQKAEEAKLKIRNVREEEMKKLKQQKTDSAISEDEFYSTQEDLQKELAEYNEKVKQMAEEKETDVKTI